MSRNHDLFAQAGPRWFSIPSGRSFLDDLAKGVCEALGDALPEAQILTPTRRGARAMARAFTEQCRTGALLLPQIRAIGDLDEGEPPFDLDYLALDLPPAVSPMRRRFELARLVLEHFETDQPLNARTALELADSLSGFFDSVALEEIDAADRLERLVHDTEGLQGGIEAWAEHWQVSARFLAIAVDLWPRRLIQMGQMDPSQRRAILIRRLADQWREQPPQTPLLLVGSTGTAPSMADLMGVVSRLPQGAVVLPGLDLSLAEDVWAQIEDSHPQGAMKRLLDRHSVGRDNVRTWPASVDADRARDARRRLLNEALRPAEATKDWLRQIETLKAGSPTVVTDGLQGLSRINARHDEEAAAAIALLMREALETPDKTVALITPDTTLARRVYARLSRWGLAADSSAGETLAHTLVGRFFHDLLDLLIDPYDAVTLLSLLKNPLCRFADDLRLNDLERYGLRGAKPQDFDEVRARLTKREKFDALSLCEDYVATTGHATAPKTDLSDRLRAIIIWAEALSAENGQALWQGAGGAAASSLFGELLREGVGYAVEDDQNFVDILRALIRQVTVRTGGNTHPRLSILGAIEARLVTADRLILAGLEDGVWPQPAPIDPFLSRPMRKALGLPSPERRTGLSAHDFVQAACGPDVWLITRQRREGEPQVASRWLWRLETLATGAGETIPHDPRWLDYARRMDEGLVVPPSSLKPAQQPNPAPPVAVRPLELPVTQVETWERDPYAIYARYVLKLRPLDRPNEPFEAMRRGTAIHAVAERFAKEDAPLGNAGEAVFTDMLETQLRAENLSEAQLALQRPLFADLSRAFVEFEAERRVLKPRLLIEAKGRLSFPVVRGAFTVTAKADRIEVREDAIDVLDFKTGIPPAYKAVIAGFYPQLTLTAAIIKQGQFEGLETANTKAMGELLYVRLSSDVVTPKVVFDSKNPLSADELADQALARLKRRVHQYENPSQGYKSWRAPQYRQARGGDYDQLARLYEWHVLGDQASESESGATET